MPEILKATPPTTNTQHPMKVANTPQHTEELTTGSFLKATSSENTDVLENRLEAWRTVVKDLINYFEEISDTEVSASKGYEKSASLLEVPFKESHFFVDQNQPGMQNLYLALREHTAQLSNFYKNINESVLENSIKELKTLRDDIKRRIKDIKSEHNTLNSRLAKTRDNSRNHYRSLSQAASEIDTITDPEKDPWLVNHSFQRQLHRDVNEENNYNRSIQTSISKITTFESSIVQNIKRIINNYYESKAREASTIDKNTEHVKELSNKITDDCEWKAFHEKNPEVLPIGEVPTRAVDDIPNPYANSELLSTPKEGMLGRKSGISLLKSWKDYYFVLAGSGFLHAFPAQDYINYKEPEFSIPLHKATLAEYTKDNDSPYAFEITDHSAGGMFSSEKTYLLRANSKQEYDSWFTSIRNKAEKILVNSEYGHSHGVPIAAGAGLAAGAAGAAAAADSHPSHRASDISNPINPNTTQYNSNSINNKNTPLESAPLIAPNNKITADQAIMGASPTASAGLSNRSSHGPILTSGPDHGTSSTFNSASNNLDNKNSHSNVPGNTAKVGAGAVAGGLAANALHNNSHHHNYDQTHRNIASTGTNLDNTIGRDTLNNQRNDVNADLNRNYNLNSNEHGHNNVSGNVARLGAGAAAGGLVANALHYDSRSHDKDQTRNNLSSIGSNNENTIGRDLSTSEGQRNHALPVSNSSTGYAFDDKRHLEDTTRVERDSSFNSNKFSQGQGLGPSTTTGIASGLASSGVAGGFHTPDGGLVAGNHLDEEQKRNASIVGGAANTTGAQHSTEHPDQVTITSHGQEKVYVPLDEATEALSNAYVTGAESIGHSTRSNLSSGSGRLNADELPAGPLPRV